MRLLDKNRGIWAVFRLLETNREIPADFRSARVDAFFVEQNPAGIRPDDRVPFRALFAREFRAPPPRENTVASESAGSFEASRTAVNRYLARLAASPHPATLVHAQSPFSRGELRRLLPALRAFPLLCETPGSDGSRLGDLTWRRDLAGTAVRAFADSFAAFADRLRCARCGRIPAGNVADDMGAQLNDVRFARLLRANRCVLWCSPRETPDFGLGAPSLLGFPGSTVSPVSTISSMGSGSGGSGSTVSPVSPVSTILSEGALPAVNVSAMARSFVFDVALHNLVLDAVRQCDRLPAGSGESAVGPEDRCGRAFEVLRVHVSALLGEVVSAHSATANFALMHLPRWLRRRQALCFHPLLLRVVQRLAGRVLRGVGGAARVRRRCARSCGGWGCRCCSRTRRACCWRRGAPRWRRRGRRWASCWTASPRRTPSSCWRWRPRASSPRCSG